jgi:DNA-binding NarL/FixJ family response regulator
VTADVLLIDDHRLLGQSLALALTAQGHQVLAPDVSALPTDALLEQARTAGTVVLDLDLGPAPGDASGAEPRDGAALIPALRAAGVRVVVATAETDLARWGQCLAAGAVTVVCKDAPLTDLAQTVAAVASGEGVPSPAWRHAALRAWEQSRLDQEQRQAPLRRLSPREREVLDLLADGVAAAGIAARFFVAEATVRSQIRSILHKLEVSSQLQAVALLHRARSALPAQRRPVG